MLVKRAEVARGPIAPLAGRLPYFAVPRYLEFVKTIPRKAALRPDKNLLRELGVSAATWAARPPASS